MNCNDPIADMLTRIRNANTAKHDTVDVPASKMKVAIAEILLKEGYIAKYDIEEIGNFKTIHITLKYGKDKKYINTNEELNEFKNTFICTNDHKLDDVVQEIRKYWGWQIEK